ncbi:MAG TPA: T9SS type A sorting domain-containing protein [Bacteroidota bacterium]|nr:T9SS type A sorting domain-containing protein [Bacteroidota bacterium]
MMKILVFISISLLVDLVSLSALLAQNSKLTTSTFSSGFGFPSGGNAFVATSAGQQFVGFSSGPNTAVSTGFLPSAFIAGTPTAIPEEVVLPLSFSLSQNYPNPFNPSTTIAYEIPRSSFVTIQVFNVLGQLVATIVEEQKGPGKYNLVWHAKDQYGSQLSSGVYFYRIHARAVDGSEQNFVQTKKLSLVK